MKLPHSKSFTLLFLTFLLLSLPLMAQVDRGTIAGKVMDPSGAVVPGAEVIATNVDTGVVSQTVTNEVGLFTLTNVPIGRYDVKFSLPGFKTLTRSGIQVQVAQTARLDVSLETGQITEIVNVTADASLLKTDTPLVSTTLQSKVVTDLPCPCGKAA